MGVTKSDIYTAEQIRTASIAKVLGHPARVSILEHLIKVKSCICGDIVEEIGLSQPTISQHLREMKDIGLIHGNIDGTKVCYCINESVYIEAKSIFEKMFSHDFSDPSSTCS